MSDVGDDICMQKGHMIISGSEFRWRSHHVSRSARFRVEKREL